MFMKRIIPVLYKFYFISIIIHRESCVNQKSNSNYKLWLFPAGNLSMYSPNNMNNFFY